MFACIELEDRCNPSTWVVAAPTNGAGEPGITDATHSGSIAFKDSVTVVDDTARVVADNPSSALAAAFDGSIQVDFAGSVATYDFSSATIGTSTSEQKPFLVTISGNSATIAFEDMAGRAGCDYDYNDRSWAASLTPATTRMVF